MTIAQEILVIANQLANDGKQPSVALVKAKLTKKVPLPTIISCLKTWQHDPNFIKLTEEKTDKVNNEVNNTDKSLKQALAIALAPIQQELDEVKTQLAHIEALLKNNKI